MGSFFSSLDFAGTPDISIKMPPKQTISLIIERWLTECDLRSIFPREIIKCIINEWTFHPFFTHDIVIESGSIMNFDFAVKLLVIGDIGVGKRSLISRFIYDAYPSHSNLSAPNNSIFRFMQCADTDSIGYETVRLQLEYVNYPIHMTDAKIFYQGVHAVIMCYDVGNSQSLQRVSFFTADCQQYDKTSILRVLVGTKSDLEQLGHRQCTITEAQSVAREFDIDFVRETSAQSGLQNVDRVFKEIISHIVNVLNKRPTMPFFG